MTEEKKSDCGFNHLTDEQKALLHNDIAAGFAQLLQDKYHAAFPEEIAMGLGHAAVAGGLMQMNIIIENGLRLNRLSAQVVIHGFAEDAPTD